MVADSHENQQAFFKGLYADQPSSKGAFDASVTKLVTRIGESTQVSDGALQAMMLKYIGQSQAEVEPDMIAALVGIKLALVEKFAEKFPGKSVDDIISHARDAGFDVQVLGEKD